METVATLARGYYNKTELIDFLLKTANDINNNLNLTYKIEHIAIRRFIDPMNCKHENKIPNENGRYMFCDDCNTQILQK